MIITRTPYRITLGGGGTDLPSFYREHGGFVFTMSINKYMYIILQRRSVADRKYFIRYSQVEVADSIDEIKHGLVRETLRMHNMTEYMEITSIADLPARTGLGSSGSYLVGLLNAVHAYKQDPVGPAQIAEEACKIEMDILKEPVGKQDQYIASFGGFKTLEIDRAGKVTVQSVPVDFVTAMELAGKARMYYTGVQRSASAVLKSQDQAAMTPRHPDHARVMDSLAYIKDLGYHIKKSFENRDLDAFGRQLDEHWQHKRRMSAGISLTAVDQLYEEVKKRFNVLGGKIIGAGGGGFLFLYCPEHGNGLDEYMSANQMPRVNYFPSLQGSKVISDMTAFDDFSPIAKP
ncbi:MAG: galactokinase [bacterium]